MNIVFISLIDLHNLSERGIYHDLLRKFREEGHSLYIIYPLERRKKLPTTIKKEYAMTILGIRTLNIQKTNLIEKGFGTLLLERQFLKEFKKHFSKIKFDLILYTTPPITLNGLVKYIKQKDKAVSYLLLKDIFPQNAIDLGIIRENGLMHKFFRKKEKKLYQISDYIGCMSPANVNYLTYHNPQINSKIIEVNPNSIASVFKSISSSEAIEIRKKYNIPEEAVCLIYGGNLGKPQGIDFLIEVLESNITNKDVFFLIIGQGTEFRKLKKWFNTNKPENSILIDFLPNCEYEKLLQIADIGLIFLDKRFTIPNFPSRLLSYFENKMPVIAATDRNTDLGKILENENCGFWCESGDLETFNHCIREFIEDKNKIVEMGRNSYGLLLRDYTVDVSYKKIIEKFFVHI